MPTNEQRRQAAKRKLARRIERRTERDRRRRRMLGITAVVVAAVLVLGGAGAWIAYSASSGDDQPAASGSCAYLPEGTPSRPVRAPDANPPHSGTAGLTLNTTQGAVPLVLDRATAACAVNAVTSLAGQGFYNDTPCHRLTDGEGLKVLQCGDPTGSGSGGPGFRYAEEPPTNLPPSPMGQGASNYSRGLVAMAKTSEPTTTGSQFFLVYGDSALPPEYTVVGRIAPEGLAVLDRVAAAGDDGANGQGDGKPRLPVQITSAVSS